MSLGGVSATLVTGGAQSAPSGADLSRTIVSLGVSPKATPNVLLNPATSGAMRAALDSGQLAEAQALLWQVPNAQMRALPVSPSVPGGVGAVVDSLGATGAIVPSAAPHIPVKVKVSTGGHPGAGMAIQISYDGGVTYGAPIVSTAAPFVVYVANVLLKLSFADAVYVLGETKAYNIDGTVTTSGGWVGVVTATASPLDNYDVIATAQNGGALGTATLAVSLDGGRTQYGPALLTPAGGILVVPGTGVVLTCTGPFTAGETHKFPCCTAGPSTGDITAAIAAMLADPSAPSACVIDVGTLPSSAASAFTLAAALESALETAFAAGKDWLAVMTCPLVGDNICLAGTTQIDTADTRATVKTARVGTTAPRVWLFAGTDYIQSAIGAYQVRRPRSTSFAIRVAQCIPVAANGNNVAARALGPLTAVAKIGDDEAYPSSAVSLYDAQINTYTSTPGGAVLTIGRGLYGLQSLTTDANEIDGDGFRAVNSILAGFRLSVGPLVGRRYQLNTDGTIEGKTADAMDTMLQAAIEKRAGIGPGSDFSGVPQVNTSNLKARLDRNTNLGPTGDKVIKVIVTIQPLGFASAVDVTLYFQGAA